MQPLGRWALVPLEEPLERWPWKRWPLKQPVGRVLLLVVLLLLWYAALRLRVSPKFFVCIGFGFSVPSPDSGLLA